MTSAALEPHTPDAAELEISAEQAKHGLAALKTTGGIDLMTIGKAFAASGYFSDARSQAQAVTKILAGAELGIPPVASMQGFHCIPRRKQVDGKWVEQIELTMSANLRAAIIHRDPKIELAIIEHSDTVCEVAVAVLFAGQWERRGSVRFTIEDARRATVPGANGQTKSLADGPMWRNYPADMLYAAVMRRISKRYAPHLFIGDATSNEGDELADAEQEVALVHGEESPALGASRSDYWERDTKRSESEGPAATSVGSSAGQIDAPEPDQSAAPAGPAPAVDAPTADGSLFEDEDPIEAAMRVRDAKSHA